jgi:hypothetical protein
MEGSPLFNPETNAHNHTNAGIEPVFLRFGDENKESEEI